MPFGDALAKEKRAAIKKSLTLIVQSVTIEKDFKKGGLSVTNEEREAMFGNMNILETEVAIKFIKDSFERELADALELTRVSAPLFVFPESGLNDDLNGVERPVSFDILKIHKDVQVVQSLAKWKRLALKKYGFECGTGL